MTDLNPGLRRSVDSYLAKHPSSSYLSKPLRSEEQAARDIAASRERHKGLTVFTSEDELKLRRFERRMAGDT